MYTDFYFPGNNVPVTAQTTAMQIQVDLVRKTTYIKLVPPKAVNNGKATSWDWQNNLVYSLSFLETKNFADEMFAIVNGTSKEANTMRSYDNNFKAIAFGKSATDHNFKIAIMNTLKDQSQVRSSFVFDNIEDVKRFVNFFIFLASPNMIMCEFIVNSVLNGWKAEQYKQVKTETTRGGSAGYQKSYNNAPQSFNNMFDESNGGFNNQPTVQNTQNVNHMVDNILGDLGGNTSTPKSPKQNNMNIDDLM